MFYKCNNFPVIFSKNSVSDLKAMVSESLTAIKQDIRDLKVMKKCTEEEHIDIPHLETKQQLEEFHEKLDDREFRRATVSLSMPIFTYTVIR